MYSEADHLKMSDYHNDHNHTFASEISNLKTFYIPPFTILLFDHKSCVDFLVVKEEIAPALLPGRDLTGEPK